jgi:hypothetical protein
MSEPIDLAAIRQDIDLLTDRWYGKPWSDGFADDQNRKLHALVAEVERLRAELAAEREHECRPIITNHCGTCGKDLTMPALSPEDQEASRTWFANLIAERGIAHQTPRTAPVAANVPTQVLGATLDEWGRRHEDDARPIGPPFAMLVQAQRDVWEQGAQPPSTELSQAAWEAAYLYRRPTADDAGEAQS